MMGKILSIYVLRSGPNGSVSAVLLQIS
jgi:hypothetical protein